MRDVHKLLIVVAIVAVSLVIVFFGRDFWLHSKKPVFNFISTNDDVDLAYDENFNPIYTMTIYVKIENLGIDGSETVSCEVTREDLTTCVKSQSVFIEARTQKIISFFFTNSDLKSVPPVDYTVWID